MFAIVVVVVVFVGCVWMEKGKEVDNDGNDKIVLYGRVELPNNKKSGEPLFLHILSEFKVRLHMCQKMSALLLWIP